MLGQRLGPGAGLCPCCRPGPQLQPVAPHPTEVVGFFSTTDVGKLGALLLSQSCNSGQQLALAWLELAAVPDCNSGQQLLLS